MFVFLFKVYVAHYQGYTGKAAMTGTPHDPAWNADKAIDGNTSQSYLSNSCAISDVNTDKFKRSFLKLWLTQKMNIAYLEIYFRSDSK